MLPFAFMLLDNAVGLWFSHLIGDDIGRTLRSCSIFLCLCYIGVLVAYAPQPAATAAPAAAAFAAASTLYFLLRSYVPDQAAQADFLGLVNTGTALAFAASPLATISTVLSTGDASSLPATMLTVLLVCASSWATYGMVLANKWMIIPNAINALLAGLQVGVVVALRRRPAAITRAMDAAIDEVTDAGGILRNSLGRRGARHTRRDTPAASIASGSAGSGDTGAGIGSQWSRGRSRRVLSMIAETLRSAADAVAGGSPTELTSGLERIRAGTAAGDASGSGQQQGQQQPVSLVLPAPPQQQQQQQAAKASSYDQLDSTGVSTSVKGARSGSGVGGKGSASGGDTSGLQRRMRSPPPLSASPSSPVGTSVVTSPVAAHTRAHDHDAVAASGQSRRQ